jgi:hypothetical protein
MSFDEFRQNMLGKSYLCGAFGERALQKQYYIHNKHYIQNAGTFPRVGTAPRAVRNISSLKFAGRSET